MGTAGLKSSLRVDSGILVDDFQFPFQLPNCFQLEIKKGETCFFVPFSPRLFLSNLFERFQMYLRYSLLEKRPLTRQQLLSKKTAQHGNRGIFGVFNVIAAGDVSHC